MELREALRKIRPVARDTFRAIAITAGRAGKVLANNFLPAILAVKTALETLPRNVTVHIKTIHTTTRLPVTKIPRRQHGGPVTAGVPYRVGESGEEIFVPGESGSVVANKRIRALRRSAPR